MKIPCWVFLAQVLHHWQIWEVVLGEEKWASDVALWNSDVMTLLMCRSIGEVVMNPVNEVRLHIKVVDFSDPSPPLCCVEGWAVIDESPAVIAWCPGGSMFCVNDTFLPRCALQANCKACKLRPDSEGSLWQCDWKPQNIMSRPGVLSAGCGGLLQYSHV